MPLPAESAEGRGLTEEDTEQSLLARTLSRNSSGNPFVIRSRGLLGVRQAAQRDRKCRFTSLLHHITPELLRASFFDLKKLAAPGVDGETRRDYTTDFEQRIDDLHGRIHRGAYRAKPSKRTYIPKPDGRMRPLGIAALEDKIVQQAVRTVLECIYEQDFLKGATGTANLACASSRTEDLELMQVSILRNAVVSNAQQRRRRHRWSWVGEGAGYGHRDQGNLNDRLIVCDGWAPVVYRRGQPAATGSGTAGASAVGGIDHF